MLIRNTSFQGLGMARMHAAAKDVLTVWGFAAHCQACAQIGATICGGISFIQLNALLGLLLIDSFPVHPLM